MHRPWSSLECMHARVATAKWRWLQAGGMARMAGTGTMRREYGWEEGLEAGGGPNTLQHLGNRREKWRGFLWALIYFAWEAEIIVFR